MTELEKVIAELKEGIEFAYHRCHCGLAVTMENALSLLKEKEPKIISLKDLTCLSRNTPIYMELRNDIHGWEIYNGFDSRTREIVTGSLWGPHELWDSSEYGRTWRCWSFPPTSEQRKKEVWQWLN